MNFPQLIYELTKFFWNEIGNFVLLIVFILTIRGDVSKALTTGKDFLKRVTAKYREKTKSYEEGKPKPPKDLNRFIKPTDKESRNG